MDVDERYSVFAQVGPAVSSHALRASNYIPVHTQATILSRQNEHKGC